MNWDTYENMLPIAVSVIIWIVIFILIAVGSA